MEADWLITRVEAALVVARRLQNDRRKMLDECDELRDEHIGSRVLPTGSAASYAGLRDRKLKQAAKAGRGNDSDARFFETWNTRRLIAFDHRERPGDSGEPQSAKRASDGSFTAGWGPTGAPQSKITPRLHYLSCALWGQLAVADCLPLRPR
jgi:hypothetical protein